MFYHLYEVKGLVAVLHQLPKIYSENARERKRGWQRVTDVTMVMSPAERLRLAQELEDVAHSAVALAADIRAAALRAAQEKQP